MVTNFHGKTQIFVLSPSLHFPSLTLQYVLHSSLYHPPCFPPPPYSSTSRIYNLKISSVQNSSLSKKSSEHANQGHCTNIFKFTGSRMSLGKVEIKCLKFLFCAEHNYFRVTQFSRIRHKPRKVNSSKSFPWLLGKLTSQKKYLCEIFVYMYNAPRKLCASEI